MGLFAGTTGQFSGITSFEQTLDVRGGDAAIVAAAAVPAGERRVVVAARFGRGIVIRTGLPELSASLRANPALAALLDGTWTTLRAR